MLYEYECPICGKEFTEFRSVSERNNVFCCGTRAIKLISLPNTDKDKAYEFETDAINGKPIDIRSKAQYKRLLKENHIADASPRECFQQAERCRKNNEISRQNRIRNRAKEVANKMRESNVLKEGKEILTKLCEKGRRNTDER